MNDELQAIGLYSSGLVVGRKPRVWVVKERIDIFYELLALTIVGVYSSFELASEAMGRYLEAYQNICSPSDNEITSYYIHVYAIDEDAVKPLTADTDDRY